MMRNSLALTLLGVVGLFSLPSRVSGALLASYSFNLDVGAQALYTEEGISLAVLTGDFAQDRPTVRFGEFDAGDVGRTVTLARGAQGDFDEVAARLTDGTQHGIYILLDHLSLMRPAYLEPELIWGDWRDPRIDLKGNVIDSISLRVDRLSFTSPGTNPNGDRLWTDVSGRLTLSFEGHPVPEPGVAVAVVLPLAAAMLGRRRPLVACAGRLTR